MNDLFKKILCILIFSEFILTSMGFCGHTHDPSPNGDVESRYHFHFFEEASHEHSRDQTHDQDHSRKEGDCKKKFRCTCNGGFIAEINPTMFHIILSSETFASVKHPSYNKSWYPLIYRPPKQSVGY